MPTNSTRRIMPRCRWRRLYGHVNDRQTLEVIRRPSRDPDAPSETALGDWIAELPAINAPAPAEPRQSPQIARDLGPPPHAPAPPLSQASLLATPSHPIASHAINPTESENVNDINEIDWTGVGVAGRPENGAPSRPVTGTPNQRRAPCRIGGRASCCSTNRDYPCHPSRQNGSPAERKRYRLKNGKKLAKKSP